MCNYFEKRNSKQSFEWALYHMKMGRKVTRLPWGMSCWLEVSEKTGFIRTIFSNKVVVKTHYTLKADDLYDWDWQLACECGIKVDDGGRECCPNCEGSLA